MASNPNPDPIHRNDSTNGDKPPTAPPLTLAGNMLCSVAVGDASGSKISFIPSIAGTSSPVGYSVGPKVAEGTGDAVTVGTGTPVPVAVGFGDDVGFGVGVIVGPVIATVTSWLQTEALEQLGVYLPTLNRYSPGP